MGDYVDRGFHSVLLLLLFLCLVRSYYIVITSKSTLARSNLLITWKSWNTSSKCIVILLFNLVNNRCGFYDECIRKYNDVSVWKCLNDVFDYLTITALVEEEVFVVHGGLSPNIQTVNQIREMDRIVDIGTISFFHSILL